VQTRRIGLTKMPFFMLSLFTLGMSFHALAATKKTKAQKTKQTVSATKNQTQQASRFEGISGLSSETNKKPVPEAGVGKKRTSFQKSEAAPKGLLNVEKEEIVNTLKGINLLLSKDPTPAEKIKLLLNRSMATYSLARKRLIESSARTVDATGNRLLNVAFKDAMDVARTPGLPAPVKARALYVAGLPLIYLDKVKEARNLFIESVNTDPKSENAGWMALFVAEDYFDGEQYREAIPFYSNFQAQMDPKEVELAKYKLAWTYLNLENPARTKALFIELIKNNPKEGFGKDSIKDLAFVLTTYSSETEILRVADDVFKDQQDQLVIDFLSAVMANLEVQNQVSLQSKVLARLLQIEKDPVKKLQYLLAGLRTARKEYASVYHFKAFLMIRDFMVKEGLEGGKKNFETVKSSLDIETQNIIKSYVETFAGRTKTPEKLSRDQIATSLKDLFTFYEKHFSDAKPFNPILRLWLDVCIEISDWKCVDIAADKLLQKPELKGIHQKVAFEQVVALDRLYTSTPKEFENRFVEKLEVFVTQFETAPQWGELSKKLGQIYVKNKETKKSLALFEKVFMKEKSADALYRLQWARFEAEMYEDVISEKRVPVGPTDPRIRDLQRESALKLAIQARKDNDFEAYSRVINFFLSLAPPADKAVAARRDYFNFMLEKNLIAPLVQEILKLPIPERFSKSYTDILERTWVKAMRQSMFREASIVVSSTDKKFRVSQQNLSRRFLSRLALGQRPGADELNELNSENKLYILGLTALARPELCLQYLNTQLPLRTKQIKSLAALALRIQSGSWNLVRNQRSVKLLGENYPFTSVPDFNKLPVEKLIQKVVIPTQVIQSQKALARWTEDIVFQTRRVRSRIAKEIAKKPIDVQVRAVQSARELEMRVADFIKAQPVPKEFTGTQIDEYQKAIAEVVKEFTDQAAEFEKLEQKLIQVKGTQTQEIAMRELPLPDLTKWNWSSFYQSTDGATLKTEIENHNYLGALIVLDLFRPEPLKETLDYYQLRSGILLSISDNKALRRYVLEELEQTKNLQIVNDWKALVAQLMPAAPENAKEEGEPKADDIE
jgi:tetratricopeptide (TPR) repeat protein